VQFQVQKNTLNLKHLQVIVSGLRPQSAPQIKQATMEFAVWAFQQASDRQMAVMAPLAFRGIMRMLEKMVLVEGRASQTLRGFLYEGAGLLAEVCDSWCAGQI
jgi:hypothetical protein